MQEINGQPPPDPEKTSAGPDTEKQQEEIIPAAEGSASAEYTSRRRFWFAVAAVSLGLALVILLLTTEIREIWASGAAWLATTRQDDSSTVSKSKTAKKLEYELSAFRRAFDQLTPRQPYLVVSSSDNEFDIRNGKKILHHGVCSTGSFILLKAADQRQWIFQTPRGMYRVQVKVEAPVWRMPDWAFIEEGLPVPPPDSPERYEYGVLGEYALAFGNGYLVHGTLYQRFLGMPVTHGCIRLGDEDLRKVYHALNLGSKIFIY